MKPVRPLLVCGSLFAATASLFGQAAPNTVSDLHIWLTDAGNTFDGTTWTDSSVNGNNATAVGFRAGSASNYPDATYGAGTASTQFSTAGVAFASGADDLMSAGGSFNGQTDVTIIMVYSVSNPGSEVRPGGIGSQAGAGTATSSIFNFGTDGSLRYDNGNNLGSANPADTLLVRAARLDSGSVTDWINSGSGLSLNIGPTSTPDGGAIPNPLGSDADAFYIGDVRAGATRVGGSDPGTFGSSDIFISQVAVYTRALSDGEVADVANWMSQNPGAVPEPSTYALLTGLIALGVILRRRCR